MTPPVPSPAANETPPIVGLEHAYRVSLAGGTKYLGTFIEVSGLALQYETYDYAEGGQNMFVRRLRGRVKYSNLTLKSGLTNQQVLLQWVLDQSGPLGTTAQDLTIDFVNAAGDVLRTFGFAHAVPVSWTGPSANIGASSVATESLEIAHHGLTQI